MKILATFRRFNLNLGVSIASTKGASEKKLGYFTVKQHINYDVIIFKLQGGIRPYLLMPMPTLVQLSLRGLRQSKV